MMNWQITEKDSKAILILKLLYLLPIQIILYLPLALYIGIKENPPTDIIKAIKDLWEKAKDSK